MAIVSEFRRHLAAAMDAARGALVFPRPDDSPYLPDARWVLVDHLRGALKRAGVVDGYRFICRRGCAEWPHQGLDGRTPANVS